MIGKNCIAVASDKRAGSFMFTTVSTNFEKSFEITPKTIFASAGVLAHIQALYRELRYNKNMLQLEQERLMETDTIASWLSKELYKKRFSPYMVAPLIAGLKSNNEPYLCEFDLIGTPEHSHTFAALGSAQEGIISACELLYKPNLEPEELFKLISSCFVTGLNRDCVSGWGAVVTIITPDKIIRRDIDMRMD